MTDGALLGALKLGRLLEWDADIDLHVEDESFKKLERLKPLIEQQGYAMRLHERGESWLLTANKHNFLYMELNKRSEPFPEEIWKVEIDGRYFPVMENPGVNVSQW